MFLNVLCNPSECDVDVRTQPTSLLWLLAYFLLALDKTLETSTSMSPVQLDVARLWICATGLLKVLLNHSLFSHGAQQIKIVCISFPPIRLS